MRNLVQVEVVGHNLRFTPFGQFQQLQIDLTDRGKILGDNLQVERRARLHPLQHVQAPTSALALGTVGGISHCL